MGLGFVALADIAFLYRGWKKRGVAANEVLAWMVYN